MIDLSKISSLADGYFRNRRVELTGLPKDVLSILRELREIDYEAERVIQTRSRNQALGFLVIGLHIWIAFFVFPANRDNPKLLAWVGENFDQTLINFLPIGVVLWLLYYFYCQTSGIHRFNAPDCLRRHVLPLFESLYEDIPSNSTVYLLLNSDNRGTAKASLYQSPWFTLHFKTADGCVMRIRLADKRRIRPHRRKRWKDKYRLFSRYRIDLLYPKEFFRLNFQAAQKEKEGISISIKDKGEFGLLRSTEKTKHKKQGREPKYPFTKDTLLQRILDMRACLYPRAKAA